MATQNPVIKNNYKKYSFLEASRKKYTKIYYQAQCNMWTVLSRMNPQQKQDFYNLKESEKAAMLVFYIIAAQHNRSIDHTIPLSKGGVHNLSNLNIVSKRYNRCKYNKLDFIPEYLFVWEETKDLELVELCQNQQESINNIKMMLMEVI